MHLTLFLYKVHIKNKDLVRRDSKVERLGFIQLSEFRKRLNTNIITGSETVL